MRITEQRIESVESGLRQLREYVMGNLRLARADRKLLRISQMTGIHSGLLSQIASGDRPIPELKLFQLARFFKNSQSMTK